MEQLIDVLTCSVKSTVYVYRNIIISGIITLDVFEYRRSISIQAKHVNGDYLYFTKLIGRDADLVMEGSEDA